MLFSSTELISAPGYACFPRHPCLCSHHCLLLGFPSPSPSLPGQPFSPTKVYTPISCLTFSKQSPYSLCPSFGQVWITFPSFVFRSFLCCPYLLAFLPHRKYHEVNNWLDISPAARGAGEADSWGVPVVSEEWPPQYLPAWGELACFRPPPPTLQFQSGSAKPKSSGATT